MNFSLKRDVKSALGVFGVMKSEDGAHTFQTLEHAYETAPGCFMPKVAPGTYTCKRYTSPEHGVVFVLVCVPDFQGEPVSYIEIHIGNFQRDSKGCILIAIARGDSMVIESGWAFKMFMELQKDVDCFTLTVS